MTLTYLDTPSGPVAQQIACDKELMLHVAAGTQPALLRFYEATDEAVVVGIAQKPEQQVDLAACAADGIPVLQRFSGGGTVFIGRGCLVFSVIAPHGPALKPFDVGGAYRHVLACAIAALGRLGVPAVFEPPCDLAVQGRKICGTAQAQKRGVVLVHGSFLVDADLARIARYLREPAVAPAYRAQRSHAAFLGNLAERGISRDVLRAALRAGWCEGLG
ncbi:MAG: lipoate--protein ligase family protein [bacterium]|nr:lipoate--protein ligase family protein [bacterium]